MTLPQSFIQNLTISGVHLTKENLHELSSCLQQYPFIRVLKIEWNPVNVYHTGKTPRPPTPVVTEEEKKAEEKKEEEKKEEEKKKSEKKSMKEDKSKSKSKKDDKKSVKKGGASGKGKKGKEEEKKEEVEEEEKKEEPPPPPPEPPKPRHSFDSFFDAEDINNIPPKEGEINPSETTTGTAVTTDVNGNPIQQPTQQQQQGQSSTTTTIKPEESKENKEKEKEEEFDPEKHMDDYSEIFAEFVDVMSPVEYLCLRGNKISSKGFKAICEKLKSCITINEINLFDNIIDDEGIEILSEMLKYNRSLYSISLSHNRITGSNLSKILSSFMPYSVEQKDEKAMRDKVISDTKNAYKELGGLLKKRKAMLTSAKKPELDIPIPKMPDLGSVGKKDNMCSGNDTLHIIDLSYNKVSDENVKIFIENLKDCFNHNSEILPISLESLILNENGLSEESMKLLEEGMKYIPEVNENVENVQNVGKKGKSPRSPRS